MSLYISTSNVWVFQFLPILTNISYCMFNFIHYSECAMVPYYDYNLHFPDDYWFRAFFMYLLAIHIYSVVKSILLFSIILLSHKTCLSLA